MADRSIFDGRYDDYRDVQVAAGRYDSIGWALVRLRENTKVPISEKAWQNAEPSPLSFTPKMNIGVQLGARSQGLIDIDLDCPEARELAGLPCFFGHLPAFGRSSLPGHALGHRVVYCPDAPNEVVKFGFQSPAERQAAKELGFSKTVILEVRAGRCYTVFPPSIIDGDRLVWGAGFKGEVPKMEWAEIERRARLLAFCAFAAAIYPQEGARNDFCLMLAGVLAHA